MAENLAREGARLDMTQLDSFLKQVGPAGYELRQVMNELRRQGVSVVEVKITGFRSNVGGNFCDFVIPSIGDDELALPTDIIIVG